MQVGVLKEIKKDEYRVALTPVGAKELVERGHRVVVETNAGMGSGFSDEEYVEAGAKISPDAKDVCESSKLLLKVKEPQQSELALLKPQHILFTYFHLASNKELTNSLMEKRLACIAYETVSSDDRSFPLLAPMSEVAGKMAPLVAASLLAKFKGGRGVLPATVQGTNPAKFVVLGSGISGTSAAKIAGAMGSSVTVITLHPEAQKSKFSPETRVIESTPATIAAELKDADALIGAVYVAGQKAPMLVTKEMVASMPKGSVIVDISIDQGGCTAYSRPTTHSDPTFVQDGVIHYCVANMPGAYPRTATLALTNATLPSVLSIANDGLAALKNDKALLKGLNCLDGMLTNSGVSKAHGIPYTEPATVLANIT